MLILCGTKTQTYRSIWLTPDECFYILNNKYSDICMHVQIDYLMEYFKSFFLYSLNNILNQIDQHLVILLSIKQLKINNLNFYLSSLELEISSLILSLNLLRTCINSSALLSLSFLSFSKVSLSSPICPINCS